MKNTYKLFAALLMALLAFQGCIKEYTELVPQEEEKKQEQPAEDDDIVKILKSIPGVSDVEMTAAATADGKTVPNYFFYVEQLVDQSDAKKGTFKQHVGMQISDLTAPVVVHTQGYAMLMDGKEAVNEDLMNFLKANWVEIEYRYFGNSLPEPREDMNLTYLYSFHAACDIHNVVTLLRENLFKNNKWVATGTSKGGITSGLQAYYSDMYGWKDFDLYIPFCAPFLTGTPDSPTDSSIGHYILTGCGYGYQEGTAEAKAYSNIHKILKQSVTKPRLRNAILRQFHMYVPGDYQKILDIYGPREDAALCGALNFYMENLMGFFSELAFGSWAPLVPDPDPIKAGEEDATDNDAETIIKVRDFFFMTKDELTKILTKEAEDAGTKAMHTAEDMLEARNADSDMPYGPQSVRELGCVGMDYGWVSGTFLTEALAYDVQARACGRERSWDFYQGQWDGGKLMRAFRQWVNTEKTQKIIFVYGSNDPWTGGAIDAAAAESNPSISFILEPGGFHTDYFLNPDYYSTETSQLIQKTIKAFL